MHFDGDLLVIAFTAITLGLGVPLVRAFIRRLDARQAPDALRATEVTTRLAAIEQAVEAIAVEVERISENQRFTTRLLAGREGPAAMPRAIQVPSEH